MGPGGNQLVDAWNVPDQLAGSLKPGDQLLQPLFHLAEIHLPGYEIGVPGNEDDPALLEQLLAENRQERRLPDAVFSNQQNRLGMIGGQQRRDVGDG